MTKLNMKPILPSYVIKYTYFYRQIIATFASCLLCINTGITLGHTSVLLPQLREDKSFPYQKNYDSWIASICPLAMAIGCLLSGLLNDLIGRKTFLIVITVPFTIGWISMGFADDNISMLICRFTTGVCTGAVIPSTMVYIGEVSDPKYRAISLFSCSTSIYIGVLISHTIGKYVYWKTSCILFSVPNIICLIVYMFLKESPLWLISKSRFDEGIKSFVSFRGKGESSNKELAALLENNNTKSEDSLRDYLKIMFSKTFMTSVVVVFLLFVAVQLCGINTMSLFAQDMFHETFSSDIDSYLLMLIIDFIRTGACIIMLIFAKNISGRKAFIGCCFSITLLLVLLIVYLYVRPEGLLWLAVTCMVIYIGVASVLTCISWSFITEIFPAKMRGFGSGLSSTISFALFCIAVKVTLEIMLNYGTSALYACFAVATLIPGMLLILILPETKGKSLQEIEDFLFKKSCKNYSEGCKESCRINKL